VNRSEKRRKRRRRGAYKSKNKRNMLKRDCPEIFKLSVFLFLMGSFQNKNYTQPLK